MTFIAVQCPHCQSEQVVKRGKTRRGTQRYLCQNGSGIWIMNSLARGK
jgi:transposase-like protein